MNDKIAYHLFFSGRVQGVCFRMTTESIARDHKVTGWVRNLYDGRVEAFVEGNAVNVHKFLSEIKSTFRNNIRDYTCNEHPITNDFKGFEIKY